MPFALLYDLCPDVAEQESRSIIVTPNANLGLPAGDYLFAEMFCNEPDCDCRRVFFSVFSPGGHRIEAVITWGWEDREFYKRWLGDDDPSMISEMQGPNLNMTSAQSENAPALLKLAQRVLLVDTAYVERIKRHYQLFRSKVDGRSKTDRKSPRKKWRRK
jgi:hypothetical protein